MALTASEAFKVGFFARCVEAGLSPERTLQAAKQAADMVKTAFLGGLGEKVIDLGAGVGKGALHYGLPLAAAAPPVLGGLAGFGLAKATDIDDTDVADIKAQEVIGELKRQADRLRLQKQLRDARAAGAKPVRSLLM